MPSDLSVTWEDGELSIKAKGMKHLSSLIASLSPW